MLKYYNTLIGLQEIPDEVSLVINIANCPIRCPSCHAKELWGDIGHSLSKDALNAFLSKYEGAITCVVFMGGDIEPWSVNELAKHIRDKAPGLKIGWYSGKSFITLFTDMDNFDFIKIGSFKKNRGGLDKSTTNQRMYQIVNRRLLDITSKFWK